LSAGARDPQAVDARIIDTIVRKGIPHCRELNMRVADAGPDWVTLGLPYDPRLVGDPDTGVLHGGAVTTLIDTVSGMAALVATARLAVHSTLDLRIDYLRPATPGLELLARADCYKLTRHVAFVRGRAYHAEAPDDLVAASSGAFMLGEGDAADEWRAKTKQGPGS
jgi:uncharacterized protein (TIGR00369 family)